MLMYIMYIYICIYTHVCAYVFPGSLKSLAILPYPISHSLGCMKVNLWQADQNGLGTTMTIKICVPPAPANQTRTNSPCIAAQRTERFQSVLQQICSTRYGAGSRVKLQSGLWGRQAMSRWAGGQVTTLTFGPGFVGFRLQSKLV